MPRQRLCEPGPLANDALARKALSPEAQASPPVAAPVAGRSAPDGPKPKHASAPDEE